MKYRGQRIRVVTAQIERDGRYLIAQRSPDGVLPLLWEFPGGRVEAGETDQQALARKLFEKFGVPSEVGALSLEVVHEYEDYVVDLVVYRAKVPPGVLPAPRVHDYRWVAPEELDRYPFPGADQQTVSLLIEDL